MFTLRKINSEGYEMNFALGENYGIELRDKNQKDFESKFKEEVEAFGDDLYGMVCAENSKFHCLFIKQKNFIMTGNGQTYSNISFK